MWAVDLLNDLPNMPRVHLPLCIIYTIEIMFLDKKYHGREKNGTANQTDFANIHGWIRLIYNEGAWKPVTK